jgi:poly(A) polymerase
MKSAKKIKPQDWMSAPETKKVMEALGKGNALFVGGCVRNALAGFPVQDIDIATKLTPDEATQALEKAGIKVVPTGIDHGTVTAVVNKKGFEITTLRKDVETDGRRAVVAFTHDWKEDAQRRDFTMNTLLADVDGNIYDPTDEGIKDLEGYKVRFVGDPAQRIAEDHLRILRFFRFHAIYGRGAPDAKAVKACNDAAGKIGSLSRERITQEFFKILSVAQPVDIIDLMLKNKIFSEFSFIKNQLTPLKHLCEFQNRWELAFIAARLFMLCGLSHQNVLKMEKLLLIPKVFKKDIEAISEVLKMPDMDRDQAVRAAVYKGGRVAAAQALMIELVQDRTTNGYATKALKVIQKWEIPELPVSGEDLKKAGIEEGPDMGRALRQIEEWWIAEDFKPGKKECLAKI